MEMEAQKADRWSQGMSFRLNMLRNPVKVLITPQPELSISFCQSITITNFTFRTRSKTAFRKQDTPSTPMQFRLSLQPAMSISVNLCSLSSSTMLGQRVTEVKVLPNSAVLASFTMVSQQASTQSPLPSMGWPRIQLKVVDLPALVSPTSMTAVSWAVWMVLSPRSSTRKRLVLSYLDICQYLISQYYILAAYVIRISISPLQYYHCEDNSSMHLYFLQLIQQTTKFMVSYKFIKIKRLLILTYFRLIVLIRYYLTCPSRQETTSASSQICFSLVVLIHYSASWIALG